MLEGSRATHNSPIPFLAERKAVVYLSECGSESQHRYSSQTSYGDASLAKMHRARADPLSLAPRCIVLCHVNRSDLFIRSAESMSRIPSFAKSKAVVKFIPSVVHFLSVAQLGQS